jgi:hypothetical protein
MPVQSALLDTATNSVLAVSSRIAGVVLLHECTPDTTHATLVHYPNYTQSCFLNETPPEQHPEWCWNRRTRYFERTQPRLVTDGLRTQARLAAAKLEVFAKILDGINVARYKVRTGCDFQEIVYLQKRMQAQRLKDSGYDPDIALQCPLVLQYADYTGDSLQQAVDDILFKAKMDDEVLAKTELLRLRYFNRIKAAKSADQLDFTYGEFLAECFVNPRV